MSYVIVVQARMGSTRLCGKTLKQVLGKPLLEYQFERLKRVSAVDNIVVATTTGADDEKIIELCGKNRTNWYRGPVEDVLARYYGAALAYEASVVVRVTSDCPLIDPGVVDLVVKTYRNNEDSFDYVSNTLKRTYPRGLDCEVFSFEALAQAHSHATELADREHVTPYIYHHPERYRSHNVAYFEDRSSHRWTVDTAEDFELIKRIIERLYPANPDFTFQDCLELIERNPEWSRINRHIRQKVYGE
jgi:spore coat polysaccharide biosynthesis protein SpsF